MSEAAFKPNTRSSDAGFGENLGRVKEDIAGLGRNAIDTAKQAFDTAKDKGGEYVNAMGKQVKDHPMTSAAVALGLGVLIGMYLFRSRA